MICLAPLFMASLVLGDGAADRASRLEQRMTLRTPAGDELLHSLERDFVDLLKESDHGESLLDAEDLLAATNDSSHWTNYSKATRILKQKRDLAAIPLLLRYLVLHAKRSSCHVMIPEYRKTIVLITGHDLPPLYESGPDTEERIRARVADLYYGWWLEEKDRLAIDPERMTPGQLQVLSAHLLKEVRHRGDFSGSGGAPDSAYGAYHNVYYRVRNDPSLDLLDLPFHPKMIPMILAPSGYRVDGEAARAPKPFPYETIPILAEFVKNGEHAVVEKIAEDGDQNAAVRLACILALFRAGHPFRTEAMLELLNAETDLERKLIILLALRWAGSGAVPVLLDHMDDPNIEIATAAGCALSDVKPEEAMPKFERLLDRHHVSMPLLLLGAMADYQTPESRSLLTRLLTDAVEGRKNGQHLYRLISAFVDGWEIPRSAYLVDDRNDYPRQAELALAYSREMVRRWKVEAKMLEASVSSLHIRLKVAGEIESLRRAEYKRLLSLQSDNVVSPEETIEALEQVKAAVSEVESLRTKLAQRESESKAVRRKFEIAPKDP